MKKALFITLLVFVLVSSGAFAATREAKVEIVSTTGKPVPVALVMNDVREAIGPDFPAVWESLLVVDSNGKELPYQIDDVDLSGTVSRYDELAFLASGPVTIRVSDEGTAPEYPDQFTVNAKEKGYVIESLDGQLAAEVSEFGTVNLTKFRGVEGSYAKDLGMIRYAGFPYSTYWVDGYLDRHEEKTTFEEPLRVVSLEVLEDCPVRVTVVAKTASDLFPGLRQNVIVSLYANGEARVSNTITSAGYADLTKLLTMANGIMSHAPDAVHVLPVFRYLDWAESQNMTVSEYFAERDCLQVVDGQDYIVFKDTRGPQPLWWGASYIFASPERWRTNVSKDLGVGVAEVLPEVPEVPATLTDKIKAEGWQLEGEWRTGYFRWVPAEMVSVRQNNGIEVNLVTDMSEGDWPLHMIPGDLMNHVNYYVMYEAADVESAIKYLEKRYTDLTSVKLK